MVIFILSTATLVACAACLVMYRIMVVHDEAALELKRLCNDASPDYTTMESNDGSVTVFKIYGRSVCYIKRFVDKDREFNLREAEELVAKLEEK